MKETQSSGSVLETGISPVGEGFYLAFGGVTLLAACSRLFHWSIQLSADLFWLVLALVLWFLTNARNLPVQSRLLAIILASGLGCGVFSAFVTADQPSPFGCCWPSVGAPFPAGIAQPLLWAVLLLHGRGVAKLLLNQPVRSPWHGIQLIALAGGLVCVFMAGPIWTQGIFRSPQLIYSLLSLAAWLALALLCEALLTPSLLKKRPGPEIHFTTSVWVWIAGNGLVAASALGARNWVAALAQGVLTITVAWLPMRRFGTRGRALVMAGPT
jgi:hypothetical protein